MQSKFSPRSKALALAVVLSLFDGVSAWAIPPGMPGFTVTSPGDEADSNVGDGNCNNGLNLCTLRAAIEESNANNNQNYIDFNIVPANPNQVVVEISPNTPLPDISSPIFIAEEQANIQVVLNGNNLSNLANPHGLKIVFGASNSTITGLTFRHFSGTTSGAAIRLTNSNNHIVQGNIFEENRNGVSLINSGTNMIKNNLINSSTNSGISVVGGVFNEMLNNILMGNQGQAILLSGATTSNNILENNTVGPLGFFNAGDPNGVGIRIDGSHENIIGGSTIQKTNWIANNQSHGIVIENNGSSNQILNNLIGTDIQGSNLGNGGAGILINSGNNNLIGEFNVPGSVNKIAFNGNEGIRIEQGSGNQISSNLIFENLWDEINLVFGAGNPNHMQPAPTISAVEKGLCQVKISGSLEGANANAFPNEEFRIEFFANLPNGTQKILGSKLVTTDTESKTNFDLWLPTADLDAQDLVTATATRISNLDSSEFAAPVAVSLPLPSTGTFALSQNSYTVSEAASSLKVTVIRNNHLDCEASVTIESSDDTTVAAEDYEELNRPLLFLAGETSKEVDIAIFEDTSFEGNETFKVKLKDPLNNFSLVDPSEAIVNILDNDVQSPPSPVCGNGITETGETCDDSNTQSGDGCNASCQIEADKPEDPKDPENPEDPEQPQINSSSGCELGSESSSSNSLNWLLLPIVFGWIRNRKKQK